MEDLDMTIPRRRLTQDLNSPSRINLLANPQKRTQEKRGNPTRATNYDPLDFIETSFEMAPTRRRTVQLNEMQQTNEDQSTKRRRPANIDHYDGPFEHTADRSSWQDREKMVLEAKIENYKNQVENLMTDYAKLKNIRTTDQETSLVDHVEWSQVKDEGYIAMRDQLEEFLSEKRRPDTTLNRASHKIQKENKELKEKVALLERELEQTKTELNSKNRAISSAQVDHRPIFDMYEDLTSLIVTGSKSTDTENSYKCVTAGKNGTFEFALSIPKDKNRLVSYNPILEPGRDTKLMSILPEFLKEDVEFERDNLPIFFWRLSSVIN